MIYFERRRNGEGYSRGEQADYFRLRWWAENNKGDEEAKYTEMGKYVFMQNKENENSSWL